MAKAANKQLYLGIGILAIILIAGVVYVQLTQTKPEQSYQAPPPEEVVKQYFESWDKKDWPNMYATLSDGFKKIDPNTKDFATFKNFASSQGIEGVRIISINEESNDGTTASVSYSVEFILTDNSKKQFSDRFTLKYRQGDIIPGWKLIHPYGLNIDTS